MKISTKARHAVTAMMDLAINDRYGPVSLLDISRCQGISLSYLEQLFAKLRKDGLVIGTRGPGGGYRLTCAPSHISIAQVVSTVEEHNRPHGAAKLSMQFSEDCLTHRLWDDLSARLYTYLDGISLDDCIHHPEFRNANSSSTGRDHMFSRKTAA